MVDNMIQSGCGFCAGTLPTILLATTQYSAGNNVRVRICRACILTALRAIEEPEDYPSVIEDRDGDRAILARGAP